MLGEATGVPGTGVRVADSGVEVGVGVKVGVLVAMGAVHANVFMICMKTVDSAVLSKTGGGVWNAPAPSECNMKSMLMQALFLWVEKPTHSRRCPAPASPPTCLKKEMPLIKTVSVGDPGGEVEDKGL